MRRRPPVPGGQDGFTLVEMLLAVAILGLGVTALVGGMMTSITVSDRGRSSAEASGDARRWAESVAGTTYADCAASYATPGFAVTSGSTGNQSVSYWSPASSSFVTTCGTDSGLQRVTLTVTSADGRAAETVQVLKRRRPAGEP